MPHPMFEFFENEIGWPKAQEKRDVCVIPNRIAAVRTRWKLNPLKAREAGSRPFERRGPSRTRADVKRGRQPRKRTLTVNVESSVLEAQLVGNVALRIEGKAPCQKSDRKDGYLRKKLPDLMFVSTMSATNEEKASEGANPTSATKLKNAWEASEGVKASRGWENLRTHRSSTEAKSNSFR